MAKYLCPNCKTKITKKKTPSQYFGHCLKCDKDYYKSNLISNELTKKQAGKRMIIGAILIATISMCISLKTIFPVIFIIIITLLINGIWLITEYNGNKFNFKDFFLN